MVEPGTHKYEARGQCETKLKHDLLYVFKSACNLHIISRSAVKGLLEVNLLHLSFAISSVPFLGTLARDLDVVLI